jgi:hypothetical protein
MDGTGRMTDREILLLVEDLTLEFQPTIPRETVHRLVSHSFESLADARIKGFVPILVRRLARQRLRTYTRDIA